MPVETTITPGGQLRAYVMCDKRDDGGRVSVATDLIEQWRCSPERLADVLARLLDIRRNEGDAAAARWTVGVLKGAKHPEHEVEAINTARIADKSDEEIRALVLKLEADRKAASVDQ